MLLSATQRASNGHDAARPDTVIRLDEADWANDKVRQRLSARKATELRSGASAEDIVETVGNLFQSDRRIVVFLDSRRSAEKAASALAKEFGREAVLTFTGGRRAWERKKAETELQDAGFLAGAPCPEDGRILVATSVA
jgi:Lhr-like helicase